MGLSSHAAAAELFPLQSALVLSGMGLDVGLDFATPVGSSWRLPLWLELMALCCCPIVFFAGRETRPPTSIYIMWATGELKFWVQCTRQTNITAEVWPYRSIAVLARGHFKYRCKRRVVSWWPFPKTPLKNIFR